MDENFTVISDLDAVAFRKLQEFYREVCYLTINHDVYNDRAVVYPSKLGPVLEKVDKKWYINALNQN